MRIYSKQVGDKTIKVYNDSHVEWVVFGGCGCGLGCYLCEMRFKQFKFLTGENDLYARTMKEAIDFYAQACASTGRVAS